MNAEANTTSAKDPDERVRTATGHTTVGALHARCSVIEPGIVLMREIPDATAEAFDVLFARSCELGSAFERFVIVVDLSEALERPKGAYLEAIRRSFDGPAMHHAVTQPGRALMRIVVGFVLSRMTDKSSVHASVAAATDAMRRILA